MLLFGFSSSGSSPFAKALTIKTDDKPTLCPLPDVNTTINRIS